MVENVGFFKGGQIILRSSPLGILLIADAVTLTISNQKNGRMGETIHQCTTGDDICPVKALALRVHHILQHGGTGEALLCAYMKDHK